MNGLSKLGIVLIVVFPLLIAAFVAELFYVLYRRRKFQQRNRIEDDSEFSTDPSSFSDNSSKELLYFFCWKAQNPVDPNDSHPTRVQQLDAPSAGVAVDAAAATGVLSWQELYGPSRVLFTIKEEEREDAAAAVERESEVVVKVVDGGVDEATPFSTPCASPFYYTPTASPAREVPENDVAEEVSDFGERTASFVSLEVHGE